MIHRLVELKHDSHAETIWLTIYADLITNMMLVFLALFGLSLMGDDAITRAIQSMKISDFHEMEESQVKFEQVVPKLREKLGNISNVKVSEEIGAVRIEFGEQVLFESALAEPKPGANEALAVVADLLKTMPHTIVVEGHTDSVPLRGGRYRDNNELALARAMSIVRALTDRGIPETQLAAAAYGSYRPRASNSTAFGRRMNRRVEIALFKDFSYGKQ